MRKSDGSEVEAGGSTRSSSGRTGEMTWTFGDDPSGTQQLIELAFSESEDSTTVVMVNSGIATDERRDAQDYGWRGWLRRARAGAGVVMRRRLRRRARLAADEDRECPKSAPSTSSPSIRASAAALPRRDRLERVGELGEQPGGAELRRRWAVYDPDRADQLVGQAPHRSRVGLDVQALSRISCGP